MQGGCRSYTVACLATVGHLGHDPTLPGCTLRARRLDIIIDISSVCLRRVTKKPGSCNGGALFMAPRHLLVSASTFLPKISRVPADPLRLNTQSRHCEPGSSCASSSACKVCNFSQMQCSVRNAQIWHLLWYCKNAALALGS